MTFIGLLQRRAQGGVVESGLLKGLLVMMRGGVLYVDMQEISPVW